jgi:hypothetical protein
MTPLEIIQRAHDRRRALDDGIARLIEHYPELIESDPVLAKMVKSSTGHQSYLDRPQSVAPRR